MSELKHDQSTARQEAQREKTFAVYKAWIVKHPEIPDCTAVQKLFEGYCDFSDSLTEDDFEFALSNLRSIISIRRVPTESETKTDLIDQIMSALQSTNNLHWADAHNVSTERKKMSFWAVGQLGARLDQIVEAQRLAKFSAGELREQLAQHRAAQQPGRVVLPAEYTIERLKDRSFPVSELKKLIRQYGADVVNDRLFGRS